jgi:hypothetical protein
VEVGVAEVEGVVVAVVAEVGVVAGAEEEGAASSQYRY